MMYTFAHHEDPSPFVEMTIHNRQHDSVIYTADEYAYGKFVEEFIGGLVKILPV